MKNKISHFFNKPISLFGVVLLMAISLVAVSAAGRLLTGQHILFLPPPILTGGIEWTDDMGRAGAYDIKMDLIHTRQAR